MPKPRNYTSSGATQPGEAFSWSEWTEWVPNDPPNGAGEYYRARVNSRTQTSPQAVFNTLILDRGPLGIPIQ